MTKEFSPLISPSDLSKMLESSPGDVKILDATFVLPNSDKNPHETWTKQRIGNAQFFSIKDVADPENDLPHMLPSEALFQDYVRKLGINGHDTVVLYGQDSSLMGPARAWWMFKCFGHRTVQILDGAFPAWLKQGFEISTNAPKAPEAGNFVAAFNPALVKTKQDILSAIQNHDALILDARPKDRFLGTSPEPRDGMIAGHMPGALNIPAGTLLNADGYFKSKNELNTLFKDHTIDFSKPIITSCGSGVTACALSLALELTGHKDIPVYDGSWSEWGLGKNDLPIVIEK